MVTGSELVGGARPGRAAADRAPDEGRAVLRAHAAGPALGHERAGVRPAREEMRQRRDEVTVEAPHVARLERSGGAGRVEPSPPQELVGDEVADTCQTGL